MSVRRDPERPPPPAVSVLHRGAGLLVVDKPAGIPSTPTRDPARPSIVSTVRAMLGLAPGDVLEAPHRLDRDTSGVLALALDRATLAALGEAFATRRVQKIYLARVHGIPREDAGMWSSFLADVARSGGRARWGSVRAGGKKAITEYRVVGRRGDEAIVECRPQTGRTHQLRVHLAEAGHPIVGDELYGAPRGEHARVGRVLLHAWQLVLPPGFGVDAPLQSPPEARLSPDPPG